MLDDAGYLGTEKHKKSTEEFYCESCLFSTSHKGMWNRHLKTKKHNAGKMLDDAGYLGTEKHGKHEDKWHCTCGKKYSHNQSYYRHKATCRYEPPTEAVPHNQIVAQGVDKDALILELLKRIEDKDKMMSDLIHRVGNNNMTNSHNTNINFYLNEHCKDAMSIQEFVKWLQIEVGNDPSLLCAGKDTKPLLKVISNKLNTLEQKDRPLHSHKKTMYLKDEAAGWNPDKDGKAANTVIGAAKKAELNKLGSLYPRCLDNEKDGEKYIQSMSELTRDVTEKERKAFEEMECLVLEVDG
jgi:hypothetical protein